MSYHDPSDCLMGCPQCSRLEDLQNAASTLCPGCGEAQAGTCECILCAYCSESIPEGEVVEFFPAEQWHAKCVHAARTIPGFLDKGEVFAIGYSS